MRVIYYFLFFLIHQSLIGNVFAAVSDELKDLKKNSDRSIYSSQSDLAISGVWQSNFVNTPSNGYSLVRYRLYVMVTGNSKYGNQAMIDAFVGNEDQRMRFKQRLLMNEIHPATAMLFVSFFPKTKNQKDGGPEEIIYPMTGFVMNNNLLLSHVEFNKEFGHVENVTTLNLKPTQHNILVGEHGFAKVWSETAMTKSPITFTKDKSLK